SRQIRIILEQCRDLDIGMVLHRFDDAIVDVFAAREPLFLPFAPLAGHDRLLEGSLVSLGRAGSISWGGNQYRPPASTTMAITPANRAAMLQS
ncbi:MAG TPA: hypothetical protein VFK01_07310, partial [Bradyrhizobium sp.]|nr:hypothetical protein [Bradyrhizobium sp.]